MGSFISAHNMFVTGDGVKNAKNMKICYKCSKIINENIYIICVRCKISLHELCEASYYGDKYWTICPRCDSCGSLGTIHGAPLTT
jgi:hypothetical protein